MEFSFKSESIVNYSIKMLNIFLQFLAGSFLCGLSEVGDEVDGVTSGRERGPLSIWLYYRC